MSSTHHICKIISLTKLPISSFLWISVTGVRKKPQKLIKLRKKKINQKNQTMKINRLEYFKKLSVWFGFDFIGLKPKKLQPNQTGRGSINRKNMLISNPSFHP